MRIVQVSTGASCEFLVYAARSRPGDPVAQLVRHLRRQGLPFLIGATMGERRLLLTIGPLSGAQAAEFAREWGGYLEDASS